MSSPCGVLTSGMSAACKTGATGIKPKIVVINFDDIASVTRHSSKPKVVTSISLVSGKKGFLFEGKKGTSSSVSLRSKLQQNKFSTSYGQELDLAAFLADPDTTAAVVARMEELGVSRVAVVAPDNNGGYRVAGLGAGLTLSKDEYNSDDADTGGGHQATLSSTDETGHPDVFAMYTSGGTPTYDATATRTAFEALYA